MFPSIEPVKAFNARQLSAYNIAASSWTPDRGGFPAASAFFYFDNDGEYQTRGYVVTHNDGRSTRYFSDRKSALAFARAMLLINA